MHRHQSALWLPILFSPLALAEEKARGSCEPLDTVKKQVQDAEIVNRDTGSRVTGASQPAETDTPTGTAAQRTDATDATKAPGAGMTQTANATESQVPKSTKEGSGPGHASISAPVRSSLIYNLDFTRPGQIGDPTCDAGMLITLREKMNQQFLA
jgi:hypothetical protein